MGRMTEQEKSPPYLYMAVYEGGVRQIEIPKSVVPIFEGWMEGSKSYSLLGPDPPYYYKGKRFSVHMPPIL